MSAHNTLTRPSAKNYLISDMSLTLTRAQQVQWLDSMTSNMLRGTTATNLKHPGLNMDVSVQTLNEWLEFSAGLTRSDSEALRLQYEDWTSWIDLGDPAVVPSNENDRLIKSALYGNFTLFFTVLANMDGDALSDALPGWSFALLCQHMLVSKEEPSFYRGFAHVLNELQSSSLVPGGSARLHAVQSAILARQQLAPFHPFVDATVNIIEKTRFLAQCLPLSTFTYCLQYLPYEADDPLVRAMIAGWPSQVREVYAVNELLGEEPVASARLAWEAALRQGVSTAPPSDFLGGVYLN